MCVSACVVGVERLRAHKHTWLCAAAFAYSIYSLHFVRFLLLFTIS